MNTSEFLRNWKPAKSSATLKGDNQTCGVCGKSTTLTYGYDSKQQVHIRIWVCSECDDRWHSG